MTNATYWYREVAADWPDYLPYRLAHETAVFGDANGNITMSLASFDTIMAKAGYERIGTVTG